VYVYNSFDHTYILTTVKPAPFRRVRLHGLKKAPQLNGRWGAIKAIEGQDDAERADGVHTSYANRRIIVVLDDGFEVGVKEANLDIF
jgi:hypothetical protein